jgi:hypothetical protein
VALPDVGSPLLVYVVDFGSLVAAIAALLSVIFVAIGSRREGKKYTLALDKYVEGQLQSFRQEAADIRAELREIRATERDEHRLAMEARRLGEANVVATSSLTLIPAREGRPFLLFRLPLSNEGDGPVDVLASLVSARVLSSTYTRGIGLRGRDVEWGDYQAYYWAEQSASSAFAGISTTKNMLARPTHFIRLAPKEQGSLRRIDAVNGVQTFQESAPHYLMYRAFLVIRGYPLGEIMSQLGGDSADAKQTTSSDQVQFEAIAQPNYARWRQVQEALFNLNRLAFRIASQERDPLGDLTDQDAWRFFLLFHDRFANESVGDAVVQATDRIWSTYGGLELPPNFQTENRFTQVQTECRALLEPMMNDWDHLKRLIRECKDYRRGKGYSGFGDPSQFPAKALEEGYPARVHQDPVCRDRWLRLRDEGYLISHPKDVSQSTDPSHLTALNQPTNRQRTIPDDPRILEPFVMRIHFFLETADGAPDADAD